MIEYEVNMFIGTNDGNITIQDLGADGCASVEESRVLFLPLSYA